MPGQNCECDCRGTAFLHQDLVLHGVMASHGGDSASFLFSHGLMLSHLVINLEVRGLFSWESVSVARPRFGAEMSREASMGDWELTGTRKWLASPLVATLRSHRNYLSLLNSHWKEEQECGLIKIKLHKHSLSKGKQKWKTDHPSKKQGKS